MDFSVLHSVGSVRLKAREDVLWAPASLVPWERGGRASQDFRDTNCEVDATSIPRLKHPLPWGWGSSS